MYGVRLLHPHHQGITRQKFLDHPSFPGVAAVLLLSTSYAYPPDRMDCREQVRIDSLGLWRGILAAMKKKKSIH